MAMVKSNYGVLGLDLGVVGRLLRLLVGVAITAQITYSLATVTPSAAFLGMAFTYFAAVLIAYTTAHWILGERILSRSNPWVGTAIILGPVLVALVFDLGPPEFQLGLRLYVGVSLLLTAFMGYGGCEVVALPSLLFGKRYAVYCPYNALDAVEKAVVDRH